MFRSWAKVLLFLSNKTFQVLKIENIHIVPKSYIIKFLVNIWKHGFQWSKPLLKWWTAVTFGNLS